MAIKKHLRLSRLHDEKNNFINPKDLPHIVPALFEKIRFLFNNSSELPIINYPSINIFKKYLSKDIVVIEWGSGRSTSWYGSLAKSVYSVEKKSEWYKETKRLIDKKNLKNCTLDFASEIKDYVEKPLQRIGSNQSPKVFIIDGHYRRLCSVAASEICTENDVIYLDDSCKNWSILDAKNFTNDHPSNVKAAYSNLLAKLSPKGFSTLSVRSFSPTHVFVKESTFFFHHKNTNFLKCIKKYAPF